MLDAGDINQGQYDNAVAETLKLTRGQLYTKIREPYFFSYVRDELIKEYGVSTVRSGGLKVYTTDRPAVPEGRRRAPSRTRSTRATTRPRRSSRSTRRTAPSAP